MAWPSRCNPALLLPPPSPWAASGRPISGMQAALFKVTVPPPPSPAGKPLLRSTQIAALVPLPPRRASEAAGQHLRLLGASLTMTVTVLIIPACFPPLPTSPPTHSACSLSAPPTCGCQPRRGLEKPCLSGLKGMDAVPCSWAHPWSDHEGALEKVPGFLTQRQVDFDLMSALS